MDTVAKKKSLYVCQECGYESSGWLGKCPSCTQWNTMVEEVVQATASTSTRSLLVQPVGLHEVTLDNEPRMQTQILELDRVLGGGVVKGSLILIGGDPGIGKSTLILQICDTMRDGKMLYFSGEESVVQVSLRAKRLNIKNPNLQILAETDFSILEHLLEMGTFSMVVIDSIQTMVHPDIASAAGSVSQVREITARLMKIAKTKGITIFIVGHVTKEGSIAGPRVLEHMVDTVLYFEGERHLSYRILRAVKNRFGSTNEIGIFEMTQMGLQQVLNPSEMMLAGRPKDTPGSVVVASLEGTRPMLIEVQGLVCESNFGVPRRMATGIDYNRITMLIAVLEKKVGYRLHNYDAYVNVIGGMKLEDPSCDLGFCVAVASSFKNIVLDPTLVFIGEVGLTGEMRGVSGIEKRLTEAARIGFKKCVIPSANAKSLKGVKEIAAMEMLAADNVHQVFQSIF